MKVVILGESSADEAAVRVIVHEILGVQTTDADVLNLRARGWPAVRDVLSAVIKQLHYRTDVGGLVVVADSNGAVVHIPQHDAVAGGEPGCRVCELRRTIAGVRLTPVAGRLPLKIAIGVAVPAVEAWYAHGKVPHVNEAAWARALKDKVFPFTKLGLKEAVYGTTRPSIQLETDRALEEATRIAGRIELLEQDFPGGFGTLASDLRGWL
jgi:hypothetical protein